MPIKLVNGMLVNKNRWKKPQIPAKIQDKLVFLDTYQTSQCNVIGKKCIVLKKTKDKQSKSQSKLYSLSKL